FWYAMIASYRWRREKSGHNTGDMYNSAYAHCQRRKFEIRCSPDVRMSRSGSGQSLVYRRLRIASSSTASRSSRPSRTSRAMSLAARTSSARLPYEMKRLSVSRELSAVSATSCSAALAALGVRRERSPNTRTRTPCSFSSLASRAMNSWSSDMSALISAGGRCQFSCENANSDSTSTPAASEPSTTARTDFIPDLWPNGRGRLRSRAQRPLPSMMIATWRGTWPFTRICASRSSAFIAPARPAMPRPSDLHDLGFFHREQVFELRHVVVVQLLQILVRVLLVVLRHAVELLRVLARVPDRDAPFLGELVHDLHQLSAPLLVERRQRHADHAALRRRIQAKVRIADRLLDGRRQAFVPRCHREQPRLGRRHVGQLRDRHLLSVRFHTHGVEQRHGGLAAADGPELALRVLEHLVHARTRVFQDLRNGAHWTMVPTRAPHTASAKAPRR